MSEAALIPNATEANITVVNTIQAPKNYAPQPYRLTDVKHREKRRSNPAITLLKIGSFNVRRFRALAKMINDLMRKQLLDVLTLQETLLGVTNRTPKSFQYEAVMRDINASRWAAGGSVMPIRDSVVYKLITKEIADSYELIAIHIRDMNVVRVCIRLDADIAEFNDYAMNRDQQ